MLKQFFATVLVASVALPAFAQRDSVEVSRTRPRMERSTFNEYVMKGFSAGLEYSSLEGEGHLKVKSTFMGSESWNLSTEKATPSLGVSASYASVPRGGFGFIAGLALVKKLEDNKNETKKSFSNNDEMTQIRPELNAAYAFTNGIYGAVGGHMSVLTGKHIDDNYNPLGIGLQIQLGYVPVKNVGMDIGYYVSNHKFSDKMKDSLKAGGSEVDDEASYINMKQLRARVSYNF
ncbi:hypothetical protein [Bdellovibrio bacteriovorus]|uniref:hypothetical protein n=1 Tax=Bdellovibrio TaxID=958 RepID=UPI0035A8252B